AVVVALAPPSIAFRVLVRLLMGIGAGVYFDFATLSFQVPIELSAPKAATVVIARAIIAWVRIVRICKAPLNFGGRGCLRSNGARTPTRIWTAGGKLENTLIAPNSIPVDQPWAEIIPRVDRSSKHRSSKLRCSADGRVILIRHARSRSHIGTRRRVEIRPGHLASCQFRRREARRPETQGSRRRTLRQPPARSCPFNLHGTLRTRYKPRHRRTLTRRN